MTARDLEDFISVNESAEGVSSYGSKSSLSDVQESSVIRVPSLWSSKGSNFLRSSFQGSKKAFSSSNSSYNIEALPSQTQFEVCRRNSSPIPLLFQSKQLGTRQIGFGRKKAKDLSPAIIIKGKRKESRKNIHKSPSPPRSDIPRPVEHLPPSKAHFSPPSNFHKSRKLEKFEKEKKISLVPYSKSLKLIGIDLESKSFKTQSCSDLSSILNGRKELPETKYLEIKKELSDAVFEEWKALKNEVTREKILKNTLENQRNKLNDIKIKKEKSELGEIIYQKWLESKEKIRCSSAERELKRQANIEEERRNKEIRQKEALQTWNDVKKLESQIKAKKMKESREKEKKNSERQSLENKKNEIETHFEIWKKNANQRQRKEREKRRQREQIERDKKARLECENKKNAKIVFEAWRAKKKITKVTKSPPPSQISPVDKSILEIQGAFENWLTCIEIRKEKQELENETRQHYQYWKPPWYPI